MTYTTNQLLQFHCVLYVNHYHAPPSWARAVGLVHDGKTPLRWAKGVQMSVLSNPAFLLPHPPLFSYMQIHYTNTHHCLCHVQESCAFLKVIQYNLFLHMYPKIGFWLLGLLFV